MRKYLIVLLLVVLQVLNSCSSNTNCHELGDNLYLLEGDRKEDRIIVYCTGSSFEECFSGLYVIPDSYENHMVDGRYSEYIERVGFNEKWIIAESFLIQMNTKRYWLLNKDSVSSVGAVGSTIEDVRVTGLKGPYSYQEFLMIQKKLSIDNLPWCE